MNLLMAGDAVWLEVLPAMGGFATKLAKDSATAATKAGKSAGGAWGKSFAGAAGDGGSGAVVDELKTAQTKTKKIVEQQTYDIQGARARQAEAAAKVILAEKALTDAVSKYGEGSAQAAAASLRLDAARDRQRASAAKTVQVEDQLKAAQREHRTVTEQLEKATKDLGQEADKQPGKWGGVRNALSRTRDSFRDAASSAGGMVTALAGAAGVTAVAAQAWSQGMDLEAGVDKVAASLALTQEQSERAGEVAGTLYAGAWGDSVGEVSSAVGTVMSSIDGMRDASQGDLERVTAAALDFANAFDSDVSEAARNAGILMKTGLAPDAMSAFDLMAASLQQVPEALRGEVTDATQEYSQYFSALGLSGSQAMGLLVSASAGGQYAVDKTGDALKELTIRATDMSSSSVAAYEAAGLSAGDMAARFLAGGDTASGALKDLVSGLQGISDPTERANAAIALFGTPLEDLGVNNIPTFLSGLAGMDSTLGDVSGTMTDLGDTLNDNTATSLEAVKRSFMAVVSDGIAPMLGPANAALKWATENPGVMQAVAVALGVLATAWAVYTVAQWAANTAMFASPIFWVVAAIGLLVAAIVLVVRNWGAITDWIREKWEPIGAWFARLWEGISSAVTTAWQWISDTLASGWAWVQTNVFDRITLGLQILQAGFEFYRDLVGRVWENVRSTAESAWRWIDQWVFGPIKYGIDLVGQAFDRTADFIGTAWAKVREAAAAPVRFIIESVYMNGIKATWDRIADAVGLDLRLPTITVPFAQGGFHEDHSAQIAPAGAMRLWAEPETGGEAYIPLAPGKRPRSVGILNQVADRFGMQLVPFAEGGIWDRLGGLVSGIGSFLRDPAEGIGNLIKAPVSALLSQISGSPLGQMLVELPLSVIEGLVDRAKALIGSVTGGGDTGAGSAPVGGGWANPSVGPITSRFGPRWGGFHAGVDIAGGGATYAAAAGRVARTGWNVLGGRSGIGIVLDHGAGTFTYYGHNPVGGVKVNPGQAVAAGQRIGAQGATGNVTGVHLHFETHSGGLGRAVEPVNFMRQRGVNVGRGLYDNGGWLQPGLSVVENRTGRPEAVLTPEESKALISGGRGGRVYNVTVNNPVPEPASRSLTSVLAKAAYLGLDEEV